MASVVRAVVATLIPTAAVFIIGAGMRSELQHHARYGHWMSYGWHGDVISEIADSGEVVPGVVHVQRANITNFTLLPGFVEACMNDVKPHEIPVYPFRIERLDKAGEKWETWPLSRLRMCLSLAIKTKTIWPLQSYSSVPVSVAAITWFHKGDWIRFVALSKCDKPAESHREFISLPFQLTEERLVTQAAK